MSVRYSLCFLRILAVPHIVSPLARPLSVSAWRMSPEKKKTKSLSGKVALVTGGSRGVSRGIALQLAEAGAKVYITGREPSKSESTKESGFPTLSGTLEEIRKREGKGVMVYCDHSDAKQVEELFKKISAENDSTLDILVNAAFSGATSIERNLGKKFYECDPLLWDEINRVSLRNAYICCTHAARLMVPKRRGLLVNISSDAGIQYFFNVPFGVGQAAVDRMSADMALELRPVGVAVVTLWPGVVKTEMSKKLVSSGRFATFAGVSQKTAMNLLETGETPEFSGLAVKGLASDPKIMKKTGKILLAADLSKVYHFKDIDGKKPVNVRSLSYIMDFSGYSRLAKLFPSFLKIPTVALHMSSYKFWKIL